MGRYRDNSEVGVLVVIEMKCGVCCWLWVVVILFIKLDFGL